MATPPDDPKLVPVSKHEQKPVAPKDPTPQGPFKKLQALDKAWVIMNDARKAMKKPLNTISKAPTGTNEERTAAYVELERLHARFYMALRSCVGIPTNEINPGFLVDNPDIARIPNMDLSPTTGEGASDKSRIEEMVDWRLANIFTPDYTYKLDPNENEVDAHIAKHIDKERKRLLKEAKDRLAAIQKGEDVDPPAEPNEAVELEAFLKNITSAKTHSMTDLVTDSDKAIFAADQHFLRRMALAPLVGWGPSSEHDEENHSLNPIYTLFDHSRFHVYSSLSDDGKPSMGVNRMSLFSETSAMFAMGQGIGAYMEQVVFNLPEYEYETDPKTGENKLKQDENGQPIPKRDPETGKIIYAYGAKGMDEAFKTPFSLTRVPSGFAAPAFRCLMDTMIVYQMMGGSGVEGFDPVKGPSDALISKLREGMSPGAGAFFEVMVRTQWKLGLAQAKERFERDVINPYFADLAEARIVAEQGGTQRGMFGKMFRKTDTKAQYIAEEREKMLGAGKTPEERAANIAYISRQRFMRLGGAGGGLDERQQLDENAAAGLEIQAHNDNDASLEIVGQDGTGSHFSASAGAGGKGGAHVDDAEESGGIVTADDGLSPQQKQQQQMHQQVQNKSTGGGIVSTDDDDKATHNAMVTGSTKKKNPSGGSP